MKKIFYISLFCGTVYLFWFFAGSQNIFNYQKISIISDAKNFIASVFFVESTSTEILKEHYSGINEKTGKIKLLIVAGHDDESGGTEFRGVKEAKINVELALNLAEFFKDKDKFEITLVRDKNGYNPIFLNYFNRERESIKEFVSKQKETMSELTRAGDVHNMEGVIHNSAPAETALKLYGINKWANENNIDIVLHIHFNDYPTRKYGREGKYSGFAVYVPEAQYSNAKASRAVAEAIFNQLAKFYPKSDFLQEQDGIVEDQKLIAIGSHNTLDSVGMLIEYGYIYEPQFLNENIRDSMIKELAFQTYIGLVGFFENSVKKYFAYNTLLLPHKWEGTLQKGAKNEEGILSLQAALNFEKLYPPEGFDKHDCPISGNFGRCTELALKAFQEKYNISGEAGKIGGSTKDKLNELYSR
ncbi:MAG: N-acetylmuramoyl-L-alanine amidase [Patescibacteria group bacterium]